MIGKKLKRKYLCYFLWIVLYRKSPLPYLLLLLAFPLFCCCTPMFVVSNAAATKRVGGWQKIMRICLVRKRGKNSERNTQVRHLCFSLFSQDVISHECGSFQSILSWPVLNNAVLVLVQYFTPRSASSQSRFLTSGHTVASASNTSTPY